MLTRRSFLAALATAPLHLQALKTDRKVMIGVCTKDVDSAAKYGFDYLEPAAAEIAGMTEEQFRDFSAKVLASPIRCHAFNSFIRRPDLKVVGDNVPTAALREYVDQCLGRCKSLGAEVVVWGSAGSRNVPEGFSRERAQEQIAQFLHMAGEIASKHKLVVAIEPLRHQESNILNTGGEAFEMLRKVKHPNAKMIIDYYHLREENEDPRILETAKKEIVHMHFANPHGRVWPHDESEDDHYASFFEYVRKINYSGGISIEGKGTFEKDGEMSKAFFQKSLTQSA